MGKTDLYLYLISHNRKDIKTHTYIGCVEDFVNRLNQHNGIVAGGPRVTRRAAGSWGRAGAEAAERRSFDAKLLKKEWKTSSRGLESRIRKGFALALEHGLTPYIKKDRKEKIPLLDSLDALWEENRITGSKDLWNNILNVES